MINLLSLQKLITDQDLIMELIDSIGIHYNPLTKNYSQKNLDVNYIMCFRKLSD